MEQIFLQQEEEFYRYNAQLELKTNALMKEVEKVMNIRDSITASPILSYDCDKSSRRSECGYHGNSRDSEGSNSRNVKCPKSCEFLSARSESLNSLRTFRESQVSKSPAGDTDYDFLDRSKKSSATDNIVRVLQSKVKILQSELNSLRADYRKKVDEWQTSQSSVKQLEEERSKATSQVNALKEQNLRLQTSVTESGAKIRLKDTENASLKKEMEDLKKEMKSTSQAMSHNEVRLNRTLEEVERLKNTLQASRLQGKELQLSAKRNADHLTSVIKKLEKQKAEVLHAFHKQVQLIENLKSQKEVNEASKISNFAEKKFFELLDFVPAPK